MTVVVNENNELITTRTVTGWRVCIDCRKLNKATRKNHFPLPFIDKMLDIFAGKEYYCFLDGHSGYSTKGSEVDNVHLSLWNLCFQNDVIRLVQYSSNISEVYDVHFFRHGRANTRGVQG